MHKKIKELEKKIIECTLAKADECGLEAIDTEELGQITDMIKDLAEARFHEATTKAMEEAEEYYDEMGDQAEHGRMGYDNYRYMRTGRYAPKGRGTYVGRGGYTPFYEGRDDRMDGGERARYVNGDSNGRLGFPMPSNGYGRAYDEFTERKRAYQANQSADNRRMMEESADKHLDEAVITIKEMWADVDQPMRQKMKEKLTKLIHDMA